MFGFIKKGLNKVQHAVGGAVHAVSSVAHNHLFQEISGGVALVFPPAALAGVAIHAADTVAHHAQSVLHTQHGIDAADHVLQALNGKDPAHKADADKVIAHTKLLASQGHADAQRGLVLLYRRAAAQKHLCHFYVDKRSGRIIDKRTRKPACNSPACAAAHPAHPQFPGRAAHRAA